MYDNNYNCMCIRKKWPTLFFVIIIHKYGYFQSVFGDVLVFASLLQCT